MSGIKERWKRMSWIERVGALVGFPLCLPVVLMFLFIMGCIEAMAATNKLFGGDE